VRSDCAAKSLQALRTYRPAQYPPLLEELATPKIARGVQPPPPQLLGQVQPVADGVVLKGTSAVLAQPRSVAARDAAPASGNARQDDASDLRPGQRPTDARAPAVVPAKTNSPASKSADAEPEDVPK